MKYYAGIGSRETPDHILKLMHWLAMHLKEQEYVLRSGGADGADTAFGCACPEIGSAEIFRAEDCTPEAMKLSSKYHPNWAACKPYVRKLHGRNAMIILGARLDNPVDFVLCWTPQGSGSGGTGQGIRIADAHYIPIIDLGGDDLERRFKLPL